MSSFLAREGEGLAADLMGSWIGTFSYAAVFCLLAAAGVGVPVAEELVILTGGVLASRGGAKLLPMMAAAYAGTLAGDLLLYAVGRRLGSAARSSPRLARVLTPSRLARVQRFITRRGAWAVASARFIPGLRAPTFAAAGMSGLALRKFLVADACAALITAPGLTWAGHRFGLGVLTQVREGQSWLWLPACTALLVVAAVYLWRRRP